MVYIIYKCSVLRVEWWFLGLAVKEIIMVKVRGRKDKDSYFGESGGS